eukprot:4676620-Prymnesium_polylepis.1
MACRWLETGYSYGFTLDATYQNASGWPNCVSGYYVVHYLSPESGGWLGCNGAFLSCDCRLAHVFVQMYAGFLRSSAEK